MADFTLVQGTPRMVDHTPGSAVAAGEAVIIDNLAYIAHLDIAASELGALAAGGGIYDCEAFGTVADGEKVYLDSASGNEVGLSAQVAIGSPHIGFVVPREDGVVGGNDGDTVRILHAPDGSTAAGP